MIINGLSLVKPLAPQQPETEKWDEPGAEQILDDPVSRIVAPISDYIPLADEIRSKTSDSICIELATECDRLRVLIFHSENDKESEPGKIASIVARRLSALKLLSQRLDEAAGKEEAKIELATISWVISMVRDVLRETGVSSETREIVFQKLLARISAKREAMAS